MTVKYPHSGDCPDVHKHTVGPRGYLAWHEWAEKMVKTHHQIRCKSCGFWSIWVPTKDKP